MGEGGKQEGLGGGGEGKQEGLGGAGHSLSVSVPLVRG